jgi:hypothetical protein
LNLLFCCRLLQQKVAKNLVDKQEEQEDYYGEGCEKLPDMQAITGKSWKWV